MTAGHAPPRNEQDFDEVLKALKQALKDDPRLRDLPTEEVVRQHVLGAYLKITLPCSSWRISLGYKDGKRHYGPHELCLLRRPACIARGKRLL